ncbi:glycosyltransferase [Rubrivivax gelatinosus]|uniref:Galactosyldiacylglycerol synthase n=1 Tax=Rubrivivax gelatinosus TaxID=28068 RepID=A0ABS1DSZ2_RUBGE|nr:glycosyltransferase [Rubrivivax gelatinosus]MBK1713122.1 galactosyldiacylglycerol synthase [Rubrivivax gelatinosus]
MTTIDLVYFNAGGGHRAAVQALQEAAKEQGRPWTLRPLNLVRVLDPNASFQRLTGFEPEDYYNLRLRRGWTAGLAQELKLLQGMIHLAHRPMLAALRRHWLQARPDLVVSVVPNFNRVLAQSLQAACPGVPFATVMTDLADHPPRFWIEPGVEQHLVCGTPRAAEQALAAGVPGARLHHVSGMVLRPAFYRQVLSDRRADRAALGLDPDRPVAAVMFGGHGSRQMLKIARALPDTQLLLLCGHNAALQAELKALQRPAAHVALGFTQNVPRVLQLADVFVGKPGPGSISEAVQLGLPVLSFENASTLPQERYNVQWLRELGLGLAVASVRELPEAMRGLLQRLPQYQARVRWVDNRAVYEVLEVFDELLRTRGAAAQGQREQAAALAA